MKAARRKLGGPLAVTALVIGSAPVAVPPLQDAATGGIFAEATLGQPPFYLVGAPLFGVWDTLTVLTTSQHLAVLGTLVLMYLVWRLAAAPGLVAEALAPARPPARPLAREALRPLARLLAREVLRALAALAALLAFYAAAALIPRPMTGIRLASDDLLAVDFHSHTNHSHDGWSLFTAARNRAWHEAGGFDAAYITDHYTWEGVDEALPANPARAGERTVLLSGMEVRLRGRHTNLLGDRSRYVFALDSTWHHLDPDSLAAAGNRGAPPPTMLYALPGALDRIVPLARNRGTDDRAGGAQGSPAGVIGVELSDGAPRGLEQVRTQRNEILALADSMDLAVVAGTNLHGWGRTVPAWSVMRIPGWREMSPDQLGRAIEEVLHRERRRAATVVERRVPYHGGSAAALAATVPVLAWEHFRVLTLAERLSWLAWAAVWVAVRARRGTPPGRARRRAGGRG